MVSDVSTTVAEIFSFHGNDKCVSDPALFREVRDIAEETRSQGMQGQFWGRGIEDSTWFVWILLWDSYEHHAATLASSVSGSACRYTTEVQALAKEPVKPIYIHFNTHAPYGPLINSLTAPLTATTIYKAREDVTGDQLDSQIEKAARSVEGEDGNLGSSHGKPKESGGIGVYLHAWESLEAHMYQGDKNESFKETGENAIALVSHMEIAHIKFRAH